LKNWKDNIYFVLVGPREPGNIGAAARAIKNMGFKNLCLVNPPSIMTDESRWFARNAVDILESAHVFHDVKSAIIDKSVVVGTSRRTGKSRGLFLPAEQGAQRLFEIACINKVAILFGREDRGLFNEEVDECGFLMTIPASKNQPSLNLAQAVLIVAYELSSSGYSADGVKKTDAPPQKLVSLREISAMYERIEKTLKILKYIPRGNKDVGKKIMQNLKHFVGRAGLTDWELRMLLGICSRIEKKITADKD